MAQIDGEHLEAFNSFNKIMYDKLNTPKNLAKPSWRNLDRSFLLKRIDDEYKELQEAFQIKTDDEIISECADVANFCMMLVDVISRGKK